MLKEERSLEDVPVPPRPVGPGRSPTRSVSGPRIPSNRSCSLGSFAQNSKQTFKLNLTKILQLGVSVRQNVSGVDRLRENGPLGRGRTINSPFIPPTPGPGVCALQACLISQPLTSCRHKVTVQTCTSSRSALKDNTNLHVVTLLEHGAVPGGGLLLEPSVASLDGDLIILIWVHFVTRPRCVSASDQHVSTQQLQLERKVAVMNVWQMLFAFQVASRFLGAVIDRALGCKQIDGSETIDETVRLHFRRGATGMTAIYWSDRANLGSSLSGNLNDS
ncbi:unnamed protein product [Pleuronectes platessa]|uniref:Uncharacterized protein n=1 Tax=Pleuronectes platessa TaxID=8262 RepID=A0A9N7TVI5_PLEPL|nr:unnamed protein product [Pleuronectes platessa]